MKTNIFLAGGGVLQFFTALGEINTVHWTLKCFVLSS